MKIQDKEMAGGKVDIPGIYDELEKVVKAVCFPIPSCSHTHSVLDGRMQS